MEKKVVRNRNYKKFVVLLLIIIALILFVGKATKEYIKEEATYNYPIAIINSKGTNYIYSDISYKILYNTVWVPLNETFKGIFESDYADDEDQEIYYNGITIKIKNSENIIEIPNIYENENYKIDDTIKIEVETIENTKYIPVYLVSTIKGVVVEIDNQKVYDSFKYISAIDAINDGRDNHKVVIKTNQEKNTKETTYVGEQDGALWREEAKKRIEKYRKKNIAIKVKNQNNLAIDSTKVNISMVENEFNFGTAIRDVSNVNSKIFNLTTSEEYNKWYYTEKMEQV